MESFQVHILAADRTFYEGPCESLTIPTSDGEQGILARHSAMIAAVQPGTLRYRVPGQGVQLAAVSPGMVKVEANEVLRRFCRRRAGRSTSWPRRLWPGPSTACG